VDETQRDNIRDDLKGILKGELLFDDLSRALYSTDASIFQVRPLGVVVPRDEADVQALVRFAAEHQIPLVPRGAGSGVAGESLGPGIIVDCSRHFRDILEVGEDTVRVQPGVVCRELNVRLARVGRRFAPDPASGDQCTIGGMLANNASGARCLRHGYTRDHVVSVRAVLDTGEAADFGRELAQTPAHPSERVRDIVRVTAALLERSAGVIRSTQPRTPYNRCGYLVHDVFDKGTLDLAKILVGSEGTLAIFTEATLKTIPLPAGRSLVLLGFDKLDAALRAAPKCLPDGPSACELIDHRLLTLARECDPAAAALIPAGAAVILLVEFESDTLHGAAAAAAELADRLTRDRDALHAVTATEPEAMERLWSLRETVLPSLYGLRGKAHPIPFVEDVGVPVEELSTYLRRVQDVLQKYEVTASFFVHAGTGQVHTRPFLDLQQPNDVSKLWALADEIHNLALDLGGTVSTQHGTGLARTPWVARQYGRLYPVLRELKSIFDPHSLFNPGKIIGPIPEMPAWPLRRGVPDWPPPPPPSDTVEAPSSEGRPAEGSIALLHWRPGEVPADATDCNGCGQCRTSAPHLRMCPIFRTTRAEAATPRAKANLLRHLLQNADPGTNPLSTDAVREVADLCVNCKMCAHECPAHINVPKLMLEAKAANVAEHGLTRGSWALARTEGFAATGSALAFLVNLALGNAGARWLLEKVFGISRRRRLPTFAPRNFLQRAARRGLTKLPSGGRPRVAYFVDVFANYNDPLIAEAAVAVLRHNGFDVYVPPDQVGCGMAPLAQGDVEGAREAADTNLRALADLAREGYPILCSEPTAAVMLRQDYRDLIDNVDSRLVSERAVELTAFLGDLHRAGKLRTDFRRLDLALGHHVPCHVKALGRAPDGPMLLSLIPGVRVHTIDVSCSGMAGTFGLAAENYALSREAGQPMLEELSRPRVLFGSTECSACRLQMEDGAGKRTLHPVQYLALAYGLMPEITQRLNEPIRNLVLR
jgi:FAD/FMN-containing dehydrogenase/Fe-S oxidoreductase